MVIFACDDDNFDNPKKGAPPSITGIVGGGGGGSGGCGCDGGGNF